MQKITPSQKRRLHQLLNELGYMAYKSQIIGSYTEGREEHSSEMRYAEAISAIAGLEAEVEKRKKVNADRTNRMRRKLIALCYQVGWVSRFCQIQLP